LLRVVYCNREAKILHPSIDENGLLSSNSAKQARWKKEQRRYQVKHPFHCNTYQSEWQKKQPDNRIENECEQRQRPAKDEQETPE
jgi:hypothetical protein